MPKRKSAMAREEVYTKYADIPQMIRGGQYEVDFDPNRLTLHIDELVATENLQLDPDFQRGHVWNESQQRAYIEFFLRGGLTARVLYFNNPSWSRNATTSYNDFVIVDGKQRLEAWRKFNAGKLKVFGSYCNEFTDKMRTAVNTMKMNINNLQTRAEVLRWYIDFNSGGVVHTDEEIIRVKKLLAECVL